MLQILIWGVCVVILGIGYCASELTKIAAKDKAKETTGVLVFVVLVILAGVLFYLSIQQGSELGNILNR